MISISQIIVTVENPKTPFFENQGPSFFVSNYSKPKIKVTVESDSEIVSYSYFGSLLGNDSSTPFVTSSSEYIGPIIQTAEESLYVTVSVTNSNGETATQSSSFVTIQEYTLPSITDIEYVVGDWIQSPTGYEWQDNPGGTSLKVSCFVHLSLDDIALNPPNSCIVQFLINDWVYVTSNNYQTGIPEVVAVLSDVLSGKDFDLSVRVRDSISGWIRQTVTVSAPGSDVIPISRGGTGATNASDACDNLGIIPASGIIPAIVAAIGTESYTKTDTGGNQITVGQWQVTGKGFVWVTCQMQTTGSGDYGNHEAWIYRNRDGTLTEVAYVNNRTDASYNGTISGEAYACFAVRTGDIIDCRTRTSRTASTSSYKRYARVSFIGCTLTYL